MNILSVPARSVLVGIIVSASICCCACAKAQADATSIQEAGQSTAVINTEKVAPTKVQASVSATPAVQATVATASPITVNPNSTSDSWKTLLTRLQSDNMGDPAYAAFFVGLPEYSAAPMGVKIKELFTTAFLRKKAVTSKAQVPSTPRPRIYKGVVSQKNMETCAAFLETHKVAFAAVEKKYSIPKEMIVSLLFVETRLGTYLGNASAFWSLAAMASATTPELVKEGVKDLPITEEHAPWLQAKLTDKSEWAYKELKAMMRFCLANNLDPKAMPGSVYGAVGICQFMPSNLIPYGDDGDGDGVIDPFNPPDAIFSAAKYLTAHGWKKDEKVEGQRKALRRYNNLRIYADTIITLGESLQTNTVQIAPSDFVLVAEKKASPKKISPKKSSTKKPNIKKGSTVKKTSLAKSIAGNNPATVKNTPPKKVPVKKQPIKKVSPTPRKIVPKTPTPSLASPATLGPRKIEP